MGNGCIINSKLLQFLNIQNLYKLFWYVSSFSTDQFQIEFYISLFFLVVQNFFSRLLYFVCVILIASHFFPQRGPISGLLIGSNQSFGTILSNIERKDANKKQGIPLSLSKFLFSTLFLLIFLHLFSISNLTISSVPFIPNLIITISYRTLISGSLWHSSIFVFFAFFSPRFSLISDISAAPRGKLGRCTEGYVIWSVLAMKGGTAVTWCSLASNKRESVLCTIMMKALE